MPFCYEYECPECEIRYEVTRKLEERNNPGPECKNCPGIITRRVQSRVNFNPVFAGSERAESLADKAVRESEIAQDEGFRSKDELQTAIGQAEERAKQLGVPVDSLVGNVPSPFEGERYKTPVGEVKAYEGLVKKHIDAHRNHQPEKAQKIRKELNAFEADVNKRAKAANAQNLKFKPKRSKEELKKAVINSQRERSGVAI